VIGVITLAKLGVGQFDEDDLRLLEVLAGHASVSLENARLYDPCAARPTTRRHGSSSPTRSRRRARSTRSAGETVRTVARLMEASPGLALARGSPCRELPLHRETGYSTIRVRPPFVKIRPGARRRHARRRRKTPFLLEADELQRIFANEREGSR
jgi:hypothetical protein